MWYLIKGACVSFLWETFWRLNFYSKSPQNMVEEFSLSACWTWVHCHFSRCQALGECCWGATYQYGVCCLHPLPSGTCPPRRTATSGRSTRRRPTGASAPAGTLARTWSPSHPRVERALRYCIQLLQILHPLFCMSPAWFYAVISFLHKSCLMVL